MDLGALLQYVPQTAIPLVVCVCFYIFIQAKRKETKAERDKDSMEIHDSILKMQFELQSLKDDKVLVHTVQSDLQEQVNQLTTAVAKLSVSVEQFSQAVTELRNDIREMRKQ